MWLDSESVIQSEVSQKEKNKHCILMYIYMDSRNKIVLNPGGIRDPDLENSLVHAVGGTERWDGLRE